MLVPPDQTRKRIVRALLSILVVVTAGTTGFMFTEGWDFGHALFFTLITITTVGYGDYGLSITGEHFTIVLLIFGIGTVTYAFSQLAQQILDARNNWRSRMERTIARLDDHFIVCGLGQMGRHVCDQLVESGHTVVGIDDNPEAVQRLLDAGQLAELGDATEENLLDRCAVHRARGLACLTNSDTDNIVITLGARGLNPDLNIIARAASLENALKLRRAGASQVICPTRSGAVEVANMILRPNLAEFLRQTHSGEAGIEFAELSIPEGSAMVGSTIKECGMQYPDVVFVAIRHADGITRVRPAADDTLVAGDVLIVAASSHSVEAFGSTIAGRAAA